jgi:hypothetical protein
MRYHDNIPKKSIIENLVQRQVYRNNNQILRALKM